MWAHDPVRDAETHFREVTVTVGRKPLVPGSHLDSRSAETTNERTELTLWMAEPRAERASALLVYKLGELINDLFCLF